MLNSLAQVLVKMTSPGCLIFTRDAIVGLRLVDPDNRGPSISTAPPCLTKSKTGKQDRSRLLVNRSNQTTAGLLYLIWRVLNLRRRYPRVFLDGPFVQMKAIGKRENNVVAYARRKRDIWIMTVVPRWMARSQASLTLPRSQEFWVGSHIVLPPNAPQSWMNVLTGETVKARQLQKQSA
jgi:(1->4)-alpha-D-glucan 1-alpha-D-glucosylmutase